MIQFKWSLSLLLDCPPADMDHLSFSLIKNLNKPHRSERLFSVTDMVNLTLII